MATSSAYSIVKFSGLVGYGQAEVNILDSSKKEEPLYLGLSLDYDFSQKLTFSLEHFRTAKPSPFGTKVGVTTFTARYSFFVPHVQVQLADNKNTFDYFQQRNIVPWLGLQVGLAQATLFKTTTDPNDKDSSMTGFYLGTSVGADYSLGMDWGIRSELKWGSVVAGPGDLKFQSLAIGLFQFL